MNKWLKSILYIVLILAIITVIYLMFWNRKINDGDSIDNTTQTEENVETTNENNLANTAIENNNNEEDIIKDLESFFGNDNWYENIGWDFGFINTED
jgi:FtsZ-interacting cell division protein ZipA